MSLECSDLKSAQNNFERHTFNMDLSLPKNFEQGLVKTIILTNVINKEFIVEISKANYNSVHLTFELELPIYVFREKINLLT